MEVNMKCIRTVSHCIAKIKDAKKEYNIVFSVEQLDECGNDGADITIVGVVDENHREYENTIENDDLFDKLETLLLRHFNSQS